MHFSVLIATILPMTGTLEDPVIVLPDDVPAQSSRTSELIEEIPVYPWKCDIVTTTFWVGERPTKNNPVPNTASSWDTRWVQSFGGYDSPKPADRDGLLPARFIPRQNPFYVALPYNDITKGGTKLEAPLVIPWFRGAFLKDGISVCKGRWIAVRNPQNGRIAYAQWEDVGPFHTDHWQYVFGNERPRPNINKGAGLDVSPAVRDFLGLPDSSITDWRHCELWEVPEGPWRHHGDNNFFAVLAGAGGIR